MDKHLGEYYAPKDIRPLSIVNTDNRLIAGAYRYLFQPVAEDFVSCMQKALLLGRSMLTNIVDIDFETMRVSLTQQFGALDLFDFYAAFPSLSHEYMWTVLEHIGVPPHILNAFKSFYFKNTLCLKMNGRIFWQHSCYQWSPAGVSIFTSAIRSCSRYSCKALGKVSPTCCNSRFCR